MTYEYLCEACGHAWEAQQPISAEPLKNCPNCSQPRAKRQISRGVGFILKGGGWYSDLYSSAKSDSSKGTSESTPSSSESSSSSSGDSSSSGSKESAATKPAVTPTAKSE